MGKEHVEKRGENGEGEIPREIDCEVYPVD